MDRKQKFRIYADTSVFGGCLDDEFTEESNRFFELIRSGQVLALVSQVVVDELAEAPPKVREVLESLPPECVAFVDLTREIIELRNEYLAAGIVGRRSMDDATHVAAATVARADAIVSWNFRHIVRLDKMRAYNLVNLQAGYGLLSIVSPQEVWIDEDE
jgi:predicted nucleic acid-binding protein